MSNKLNQNQKTTTNTIRNVRVVFVVTILIFGSLLCNGQVVSNYSQRLLDSLENIQHRPSNVLEIKGKPYRISIKNQSDFNLIQERVQKALSANENIIQIKISKGTYFYQEDHLTLSGDLRKVSISIEGKGAVLIATDDINYQRAFSPHMTLVDKKTTDIYDYWGEVTKADSLIDVVDVAKKLCRIPYSKIQNVSDNDAAFLFVTITQWFRSRTYKVSKIEDGFIYFIADNLHYLTYYKRKNYNVNYDYIYGGQTPRFMLSNRAPNATDGSAKTYQHVIHECHASRFISLNRLQCHSFIIKGLRFVGNRNGSELIGVSDVNSELISIRDCKFEGIQSTVIKIGNTSNTKVDNNRFSKCYSYGLMIDNHSMNISVENNYFVNCGLNLSNSFCVMCEAQNYYIANNKFENFGYGAIGLGVYHEKEKLFKCTGIVENNEMWYDRDYCIEKDRHTVMDSGAIYLWTQNDDAIIRYNYIHDYVGMKDNRGIFCDDGASNFKLYGNIILNTPDGYSIDSYRKADQRPGSFKNNVNNVIMYNLLDHSIRFEGRNENNNGCLKACNYVNKDGTDILEDCINQVVLEDDYPIKCLQKNNSNIYMTMWDYRQLTSVACFKRNRKLLKTQ